jgi:Protein of unknown function (DUF1573)
VIGATSDRRYPRLVWRAAALAALGLAAGTLAALGLSAARSPASATSAMKPADEGGEGLPLRATPGLISLGTLGPGQTASGSFELQNRGTLPVEVARVETSCPCLEVGPAAMEIAPGGSAALTTRFNPAAEPDFRGRLAIEVAGRDRSGQPTFRARVRVEVGEAPSGPRAGRGG